MEKTAKGLLNEARSLYNSNPNSGTARAVLEKLFGKEQLQQNITDRVKSYEDACEVLGIKPLDPSRFFGAGQECVEIDRYKRQIIALIKLQTITKALNEGWTNPQNGSEYVYWPWFYIMNSKDETKSWQNDGNTVVDIPELKNAVGLACSYSYSAPSSANAYFGSRLCFKTRELAIYAAKTFTALYADFLLIFDGEE